MHSSHSCAIFAAGTYYGGEPHGDAIDADTLVIAADGGLDHARRLGVHADIVIGDFDSLPGGAPGTCDAGPESPEVIALPPEHDDPDMLSALKVGWSRGARTFRIYGGLGGRIDHTIANIQMLALLAHNGGHGMLFGRRGVVTAIADGSLAFHAGALPAQERNRMVSVFSHGDVSRGVTIAGLKYELHDGVMRGDTVLGVSNEFLDERPASIGVRDGTLIVVFPSQAIFPAFSTTIVPAETLGPLSSQVSSLLNPSR
ncbi:thiamine diphosphokinase [Bifidobacterium sp. ESL0763]|uniref:thiamine diphosphokinase n=1 Tax=Bifidobacterium sp. ESL0763 TaxID=2983227 RepID=UPI0023F67BE6|nr:thiamine diphosphokinase [Bifidobacterium sp. ESL0763]MDF7664128.1 thiamine diphosphokinase [Bifidobacterium sp. ESL0763]